MLVFLQQKLAFLAVPKTGTTSYEAALRGSADIVLRKRTKHMTAQKFNRRMVPFLKATYGVVPERMAVIRDPLDHMGSWYRYRLADERAGDPRSTQGISFDEFVLAAIQDDPPVFAGVGTQFGFLTNGQGKLMVHHLFAYDRLDVLDTFLELRLGKKFKIPDKNQSPKVALDLSPAVEAKARKARVKDFALYDRVMAEGGYIHTDFG